MFELNSNPESHCEDHLPKISIITPSFNQGQFLEETITSVLSQNYPNLEYIIIDGGSSDNSVEIIKRYEKFLSYWISEPDNGPYYALQKGFEKSTGEIMGWINSDDKYYPGSFLIVSEIFTSFKEVNWLLGNPSYFDEKGRSVGVQSFRNWSKYDILTKDYKFIQQESVFWRRSLWETSGSFIDTKLNFAADFNLWLRFFRFEKLYVTQALLGGFRLRKDNQISLNHFSEYISEVESQIQKEPISKSDKRIINKLFRIKKTVNFLSKFKIFNINLLLEMFKNKHINSANFIHFNRITQKFEIYHNF